MRSFAVIASTAMLGLGVMAADNKTDRVQGMPMCGPL